MQLIDSKYSRKRLCRSEFQLKNFTFNYKDVDLFYRCQWQKGIRSWCYLIYRWILVLIFSIIFITCIAFQFSNGKYFIFLTNWGIILCLITQLIGAILVTRWHFNWYSIRTKFYESRLTVATVKISANHTIAFTKLYWLLHGVTMPLSLVITTIYWAFLHGRMNKPTHYPAISFITHCLNSVFMCIDFCMVAFPVRLLHAIYAMLLPIVYCTFTIIYFLCGGTDERGHRYIYPILDWTTPVRSLITFAGVFCLYIIYTIFLFALYKLKCILYSSLKSISSTHGITLK